MEWRKAQHALDRSSGPGQWVSPARSGVCVTGGAAFYEPTRGHNEGYHDTFKHLFRAFFDYIRTSDVTAPATFPAFADGHREIGVCEAILRSHRERAWARLNE